MPIVAGGGSGSGGVITNAVIAGNNGGDLTTSSAAFVDLTAINTSIAAAAGDKLLIGFYCTASMNGVSVTAAFKVICTTSTNIVVAIANDSAVSGARFTSAEATIYTVVSGDISGGLVALKAQFASNGTQVLTVKNSGADVPHLYAVNLLH